MAVAETVMGAPSARADIAVLQGGGAATLPIGRVLRFEVLGVSPPLETKQRYALFLRYASAGECFRIVKIWGLKNGAAEAMEGDDRARAQRGQSQYHGTPEQAFIAAISNFTASRPVC